MRKAVLIVLALLAIRLLPKAARREAAALELITLLFQVTLASGTGGPTPPNSKTYAVEKRAAVLETRVGAITSQKGTGGTFNNTASNLPSPSTSDPQTDSTVVTTSGNYNGGTLSGHNHSYGHTHTTGMDPYFDAFVAEYNATLGQLNTMMSQLKAAGIL